MRYSASFVVLCVVFGLIFSQAGMAAEAAKATQASSPSVSPQWQQKMQSLYKTLVEVVTDASSEKRFNDPKNKARIEKNVSTLSSLARDLNVKKMIPPDADPTVKMIAGLFQDQANLANSALKSGHRQYARGLLAGISGYCVACHTRNGSGPSFSSLELAPSSKDLSESERGYFFAATRQYDLAMNSFEKAYEEASHAQGRSIEWERSIELGLAVAVRVKKDPALAMTWVERVINSKNAPLFMKEDAKQWKKSIEEWKKEIGRHPTTEEGLFSEAKRLVGLAQEMQKYPVDHSANVIYLRASAVVHELLQKFPEGAHAGDAYLLAGVCYEVLNPLFVGNLHEIYYESCIHKVPHTATAETCYKRYEQNVYFGYTGSAGTYLPKEIEDRLKKLQELALPQVNNKLN